MKTAANDGEMDEASLIKLYMDLSGASETSARNVYMFVNREDDEKERQTNGLDKWRTEKEVQPFMAKSSQVCTECDEELGIGLFGIERLTTGK
jgi:hypothetical protein